MTLLVTEGAGFLGSHLCEKLVAQGHDVISADNYSTGSQRNLTPFITEPRFEALRHDICFPLYVEVDGIYNLACPGLPVHYQHDPVQTAKTCFKPLPEDDPRQRCPDITLAKHRLGWSPRVSLEDGTKETVAYFLRTLDS